MGNERDLTPQEAVKEARKILGRPGAAVAIHYCTYEKGRECRIDVYGDSTRSTSGHTIRSCLSKFKKGAG